MRKTKLCKEIIVVKNNKLDTQFYENEIPDFDKIIFSPGAGLPHQAPAMGEIIKNFGNKKPILGICLGHQAIAEFFGASLYNLQSVRHGLQVKTKVLTNDYIFNEIEPEFYVGLYHSFAVEKKSLPTTLEITSSASDGTVMSLRHKQLDIRGLQFHPESILTTCGENMIANWLKH